jgi:hypothetical protein
MAKAGSMLGSGAIIVIDDAHSVVDVALWTAEFYRHESCGKCSPCREGTNWTVKMLERIRSGEATPMDLDIMASVCTNIIGNCLCVLGDAMAMPIGSMVEKFRPEFEAYIEEARRRNDSATDAFPDPPVRILQGARLVPRPEVTNVTFTIDGREVTAPQNAMLVDAAKFGDIEIPVFCYEPKLGQPVGACRMCLVEVEGIPKLQTACSTPVKDGMVVNTQTERVREAQQAVVEFLLINHPLDCPVCDKGGECPLQDITMGWGGGRSRFIEPKRHFQKPLALSPLIHIDRERCILCYRCVRFSQEVSEDYQLVLQERGAQTYVSTFDGHPYVAPFSGNITELCPVGALTSRPYRFRARPWDIQQSASICTLCPSQCNVSFTVRDERVLRVLARDNEQVDDGWLCDKGRFAYQSAHVDERITQPMVRDGGELRPSPGSGRSRKPPPACARRGRHGRGRGWRDDERGGLPPAAPPARGARLAARRLLPVRLPRRARSSPRWARRSCRPPSRTSSTRTPSWCSTASPSTTRRSSTCACARACAATASSSRSPPAARARWTPTRPCRSATRRPRRRVRRRRPGRDDRRRHRRRRARRRRRRRRRPRAGRLPGRRRAPTS